MEDGEDETIPPLSPGRRPPAMAGGIVRPLPATEGLLFLSLPQQTLTALRSVRLRTARMPGMLTH